MRSKKAGPGSTLRALRRNNYWTLADIAARTGIPISTLSKIENDQASPSYDQLVRLSDGLQVDIAQLFSAIRSAPSAARGGRRSLSRAGDGSSIETAHDFLRYLHTDLLNKAFTPIIAEVRCRRIEDYGEFQQHAGEEFLYIIEGEVELHTEQYAPVLLKKGDSIYFDSSMRHAYVAHGAGVCRTMSICTVPNVHPAQELVPVKGGEPTTTSVAHRVQPAANAPAGRSGKRRRAAR